jgi:hypothetical protein
MSDNDGMDSILECIVSVVHGLLLQCPIAPGA